MSTSEEQGWVPATYLEAQNGTRDDSDINTPKAGDGKGLQSRSGVGKLGWAPPLPEAVLPLFFFKNT